MFRRFHRPFAAATAALVLATFAAVSPPAQAMSATASQTTTATAFTVSPGGSNVALAPIVILPAWTTPVGTTLGNYSATPATARVWIRGWCADAQSNIIHFGAPPQDVTVPGDPSATKGLTALKILSADLTIPVSCVAKDPWSPLFPDGALWADVGPAGSSEPAWQKLTSTWIGLPFTLTNIRYNTKLQWKKEQADSASHHTLPQKFRAWFEAKGLNIDDPAYLRWWCSKPGVPGNHQSSAYAYNKLWEDFKYQNPNATKAQILTFRQSIQGLFTYTC